VNTIVILLKSLYFNDLHFQFPLSAVPIRLFSSLSSPPRPRNFRPMKELPPNFSKNHEIHTENRFMIVTAEAFRPPNNRRVGL
jgi:hypothetical protein